jgi:hypothetical protein
LIQGRKRHKETTAQSEQSTGRYSQLTTLLQTAPSHLAFHREASRGIDVMKKDSRTIVYEDVTKFSRACPYF